MSWSSVLAGVLCAVAIQIVLGLFGSAFGFASRPADSNAVGIVAVVWTILVPLIASFVGAGVAVRMASTYEASGAFLHGILVWSIGLIAGALFITGSLAGGALSLGSAASGNLGNPRSATRQEVRSRQERADDAAKSAAEATGLGGLAAVCGLIGAGLGAVSGRKMLLGKEPPGRTPTVAGPGPDRTTGYVPPPPYADPLEDHTH